MTKSGDGPDRVAPGYEPGHEAGLFDASGLDRAAARRADDAWLRRERTGDAARIIFMWRGKAAFLESSGAVPELVMCPAHEAGSPDDALEVFLGLNSQGHAIFARDIADADDEAGACAMLPQGSGQVAGAGRPAFHHIRTLAGRVDEKTAGLITYARAMMLWHARHGFCGVCGAVARPAVAGHERHCSNFDCQAVHHPRCDPAMIVLVTRGRGDAAQCLLGRSAHFPEGMISTLAGFVEPGESMEECVIREVMEEAGIRVGDVRYLASQAWPFPASLMLGFHARAQDTSLAVNPAELEMAGWFSRAEVGEMAAGRHARFSLPPKGAIALMLIERWLEQAATA